MKGRTHTPTVTIDEPFCCNVANRRTYFRIRTGTVQRASGAFWTVRLDDTGAVERVPVERIRERANA